MFNGFAEDARDDAFSVISPDSDGNESGAVAHVTADTDFGAGGVEEELGDPGKWPGTPLFELLIKGGG